MTKRMQKAEDRVSELEAQLRKQEIVRHLRLEKKSMAHHAVQRRLKEKKKVNQLEEKLRNTERELMEKQASLSAEIEDLGMICDSNKAAHDSILVELNESESALKAAKKQIAIQEARLLHRDADVSNVLSQVAQSEKKCQQLMVDLADSNFQCLHLRRALEQNSDSSVAESGGSPVPLPPEHALKKSLVDGLPFKKSNKKFWSLSDFELKEKLANGSLGSIFLAVHKADAQEVALKKISRQRMQELGAEQQVRTAVDLLAHFRHPNIVRLFGSFEDEHFIYVVLQYVEKANSLLKEQQYLMEQHRLFAVQDVATIMYELSNALSYVHESGFVHAQVSAENVIIDEYGVLLNGFSNGSKDDKHIPPPPEVIECKPLSDKVDSWGLGVLAFSLLVGYQPFTSRSGIVDEELVLKGAPAYPSHLQESARDLLDRLLAKDPEQRLPVNQIPFHPFIVEQQQQ